MTYDAYGAKAGPATPETDAAYRASLDTPVKTLRDEMAMAALTGLLASGKWHNDGTGFDEFMSVHAYNVADAMMKARG